VTLDDLVVRFARELSDLGDATRHEVQTAQRKARARAAAREARQRLSTWVDRLEEASEEVREGLGRELESLRNLVRDKLF